MKNPSISSCEQSLEVERGREERRASPLPPPLPLSPTLGLPSHSASLFEFSQIQFASNCVSDFSFQKFLRNISLVFTSPAFAMSSRRRYRSRSRSRSRRSDRAEPRDAHVGSRRSHRGDPSGRDRSSSRHSGRHSSTTATDVHSAIQSTLGPLVASLQSILGENRWV